jgi:Protein of unknown function (DUF2934)
MERAELPLKLHEAQISEVSVATTSQPGGNPTTNDVGSRTRRVKKKDAAPTPKDIAAESAAIYPDTFATPPSPEEIAAEAYNIYMARGGGHGRDMDDWLEAERRLSARLSGELEEV